MPADTTSMERSGDEKSGKPRPKPLGPSLSTASSVLEMIQESLFRVKRTQSRLRNSWESRDHVNSVYGLPVIEKCTCSENGLSQLTLVNVGWLAPNRRLLRHVVVGRASSGMRFNSTKCEVQGCTLVQARRSSGQNLPARRYLLTCLSTLHSQSG